MPRTGTLFIESLANGRLVGELGLKYGEITELAAPSGSGVSALGTFLRDESCRRLNLNVPRKRFRALPERNFRVKTQLGFVELIDGTPAAESLGALFELDHRIREIVARFGISSCPICSGELVEASPEYWSNELASSPPETFLMMGVATALRDLPELLNRARKFRIRRLLLGNRLWATPDTAAEQEFLQSAAGPKETLVLIVDLVRSDSSELPERISAGRRQAGEILGLLPEGGAVVGYTGTLQKIESATGALPQRNLTVTQKIDLTSAFRCRACGRSCNDAGERRIDGATSTELMQRPLAELSTLIHHSLPPLSELMLDFPKLTLSERLASLPLLTRISLDLRRLIDRQITDAVVFCDFPNLPELQSLLGKLAGMENAVVIGARIPSARAAEKVKARNTVTRPLNLFTDDEQRLSRTIDFARRTKNSAEAKCRRLPEFRAGRRSSVEPIYYDRTADSRLFYQLIGLEEPIAELFAAQPGARQRGLSQKDFFRSQSRCSDCAGRGYLSSELLGLGHSIEICPGCLGERFTGKVLEVRYGEHTLADLLRLPLTDVVRVVSRRHDLAISIHNLIACGVDSFRLGDEVRMLPSRGRMLAEVSRLVHNGASECVVELPFALFGDLRGGLQLILGRAAESEAKIYFLTPDSAS